MRRSLGVGAARRLAAGGGIVVDAQHHRDIDLDQLLDWDLGWGRALLRLRVG